MKLNIGCGAFKKEGFINLDYDPRTQPDVIHNLNEFPYPFSDDQFSLIEADHVLEHIEDPFKAMKEVHRILKPNGKLIIKVPHFSRGFTHPEHKRGFDVSFPYYFNPTFKGGYAGCEFKTQRVHLKWFAQPYLRKSVLSKSAYYFGFTMGKIIDFFANLSPFLCSRLWCYIVGGFEEIEFHFICKK